MNATGTPIIEAPIMAQGFAAFTTCRDFDGDIRTPWPEAGERLRSLLSSAFSVPGPRIVFAGQVHGRDVKVPSGEQESIDRVDSCDGLATNRTGLFLVIRTADCLPVVLVDPQTKVCAGYHAGWRGSFENIAEATVLRMVKLGARPERIQAWIGPAIRGSNYEVGADLIAKFSERHGEMGTFYNGRFLDLWELNRLQLAAVGLRRQSVLDSGACTFDSDALFHSHRRQGTARGHQFTVCGFTV